MFCAKQFSFQNIPERGYCWWVKLNEKMRGDCLQFTYVKLCLVEISTGNSFGSVYI